jgi:hypothetical protein
MLSEVLDCFALGKDKTLQQAGFHPSRDFGGVSGGAHISGDGKC